MNSITVSERVERRIKKTVGCWLWQGAKSDNGYGRVGFNDKVILVHRYVYECLRGKIPNGKELDHLCRVRHCCNPEHLEPVTRLTNSLRGNHPWIKLHYRKTCLHGHRKIPVNRYFRKNGQSDCRLCASIQQKQRYKEVK